MKIQKIFVCEDSLEGILSAVHAAYMSRYDHEYQSICIGDYVEYSFFSETYYIKTDLDKAKRVAQAIRKKISGMAWYMILHVAMACDADKANVIYHFLVRGFKVGSKVTEQLSDANVMRIIKMYRAVQREKQHMYGFVRFQELNQNLLFAQIAPKHRQLLLIAEHFADRYPMERWMIYDERRHEVCVYEMRGKWWIAKDVIPDEHMLLNVSDQQKAFEKWWKTFYETIGIQERENPKCRMNMMPKMYWSNMTEMRGK